MKPKASPATENKLSALSTLKAKEDEGVAETG
jgi:hypothetical protein